MRLPSAHFPLYSQPNPSQMRWILLARSVYLTRRRHPIRIPLLWSLFRLNFPALEQHFLGVHYDSNSRRPGGIRTGSRFFGVILHSTPCEHSSQLYDRSRLGKRRRSGRCQRYPGLCSQGISRLPGRILQDSSGLPSATSIL